MFMASLNTCCLYEQGENSHFDDETLYGNDM